MTFQEALKVLNIEDYGERIFNSNSHGELFHLAQYSQIARILEELGEIHLFRDWFLRLIEAAESKWKRPESIFQHVLKLLADSMKGVADDEPAITAHV